MFKYYTFQLKFESSQMEVIEQLGCGFLRRHTLFCLFLHVSSLINHYDYDSKQCFMQNIIQIQSMTVTSHLGFHTAEQVIYYSEDRQPVIAQMLKK